MAQKSLHALNKEDVIHPEAAIIHLIKSRHSYLAYRSKQPLTYPDTNSLSGHQSCYVCALTNTAAG